MDQLEREAAPPVDAATRRGLVVRHSFVTAMLDSLAEGIVACDADGQLVLFNEATMRFHGLPAVSIPPEQWAEHYDLYAEDGTTPLDREEIPLFRALRGEPVQDQRIVIAPANGPARHVLCSGQQIRDDDGTLLGAVVAMHDITRRLAAEQRAQAAAVEAGRAEQLQRLHAASGRITASESPERLAEVLARSVRDLAGAAACRVVVPPDVDVTVGTVQPGLVATTAATPARRVTAWFDGEVLASASEVVQQLAAVADTTLDAIQLRSDLLQSRAHQMRDELIAAVSHDIQTPTSAVIGLAQVLEEQGPDLSDDERSAIATAMRRQGEQLHGLVTQFMDHCRLEAGHPLALHRAPVDVAEVVAAAAELFAGTGRVRTDAEWGAMVAGDSRRLLRLVANLVGNALAYTEGEVIVTVRSDADQVVVEVLDEGPGLGDDPEALFDKYARGETDTDGSGLGLYIGRAVAEAHGGTLEGRTRDEGGAAFTTTLPRLVEL